MAAEKQRAGLLELPHCATLFPNREAGELSGKRLRSTKEESGSSRRGSVPTESALNILQLRDPPNFKERVFFFFFSPTPETKCKVRLK